MKLVNLQNIATTKQGQQVNLVLNELYIGNGSIVTPWQLEIVDQEGNVIKTVSASGSATGQAYNDWDASQAADIIKQILAQQAQLHTQDPTSSIRQQLDFFADLNS